MIRTVAWLTLALAGTFVLTAGASSASSASRAATFSTLTLADNLEHPWSVAFLPGGDMLVTERPGRLRLVRAEGLVPEPVYGTPVVQAEGQGGLLDVVLHPAFADNRFVYLSYSKRCETEGQNTTAVGRGVWRDDRLEDFREIFVADACAPRGRHHGSRIVFADGFMFVSVGDRGVQDRAQDPTDHAGVVLRLHDDGRVPADGPFPNGVFTYGNRNIQGMAVHPETGSLWAHEHGPRGGDEINVLEAGANYGWPAATFGVEYSGVRISDRSHESVGARAPVHQWTPSIAPSGMAFYTGDAFPEWRGDLLVGALAHQHVARLRFDGTRLVEQEKLLDRRVGRVRDVRVGPDGFVYVLTDDRAGRLIRLEPAR